MTLHKTLKPFEALIECFQAGVLVCDTQSSIVMANGIAKRIFGLDRATPPLHDAVRIDPPEMDKLLRHIAGAALAGEHVSAVECAFGPSLAARRLRVGAVPVRDDDHAVVGAVITVVDLTGLLLHVHTAEHSVDERPHSDGPRTERRGHDEARQRLEALARLTGLLADARTTSQVAEVIVDWGMHAARADTCTLYLLNEGGTALELIGVRGTAPEIVEKIRVVTKDTTSALTFESVHSGRTLWAESFDEYSAFFPALAGHKASGPRANAFWSVPLIVEGRPVGLLGMGFYDPRSFSKDERTFVDTFTQQCAQALLRAVHRAGEDQAERALTTTLRSIGDAVIATDTDGLITFMNPVAEDLTGWPERDARGQPLDAVFRIFSELTGDAVESPVSKVLREGTIVGLANHTVLWAKNGLRIPIDDSGAPIKDERGGLLGVVLVFRDATSEKRAIAHTEFLVAASDALASSLDYRATLATVARLAVPRLADWCAVDLLDPETRKPQQVAVAHADPAKLEFARQVGERYPPNPDAPTGVPEVIRTGKSELYVEIPSALLEAGAKDEEHLEIIRQLRLESAMVVPLRGRDRILGAMTFIYADSGRRYTKEDLAFAEDFARRAAMAIEVATSFKDLEEARTRERSLRQDAEIANRAKDEFLATVSHELRTPLNAILGWTVRLRSHAVPSEFERPLKVIERNARTQARLIEDVLDVSRIISGKLSLSLGLTNIAEAVAGALEAVAPAAEAKGISFQVDPIDPSLEITADPDRIQQVIWNLVTNAVKFTPKGGSVAVRAYREGSDVCICVTDSGEGISAAALPYVFEPFRQADASTTRRHGGLGLGLAIVKQLVVAHGGLVTAKSEGKEKGSTFTVQLPARVTPIASAVRRSNRNTFPSAPAGERAMPRLDGLKVLVVDDEEDVRLIVQELLVDQGAEVHVAGSVAEALHSFEIVRPDVLVSDIGMPMSDGYELIKRLRALPFSRGGRTPAIALTAYARPEDAERAFAAGYQNHLAKPVEPHELATLIANLGGRILE